MKESDIVNDLSNFMDDLVAKDQFSGTILVAKDGAPFFKAAYGLASVAHNVPNKIDTKFNLGSMNKMFTAVSIMQQVQKGNIGLQDKVGKYIPDFRNPEVAEKVTVHHLLTHTGGLGSFFNHAFEITAKDRVRTVRDMFPFFDEEKLMFEPGTRWSYSNSGFQVLGAILEVVTGMDYFEYVRQNIYQPAGMINSDSFEMDFDTPNLATGYTQFGLPPGRRKNNLFWHVVKGGPAGGGFSTVEDLLNFDIALRGDKLLNPEFTELVYTGKVEAEGRNSMYAYGFQDAVFNGTRIVGHGGGAPGINSNLSIYLDRGYTVAVMSNYDPVAAQRVDTHLRYRLTDMPLPEVIKLEHTILESLVGKYLIEPSPEPGMMLDVTLLGDQVFAMSPLLGRWHLLPIAENELMGEEIIDMRVLVHRDAQGNVEELTLKGIGPELTMKRTG
jgi:CubicO group peptidase (beta-lactamase class C family)